MKIESPKRRTIIGSVIVMGSLWTVQREYKYVKALTNPEKIS
jgi:hypothetical protein